MYCPQTLHPQAIQKVFAQHYYSSTAHTRNRRAVAAGNSIKCSIPGLTSSIEIPFPDRKLPVCTRCKKIYKTRELCRLRDKHTEKPWSTTYICVTLDDSCLTRDEDGEVRLVEEGPMQFVTRSVTGPPASYCSKPTALDGTNSPICMACKDKNYTRHHCRVKNKHLELPWGTVYVILSAIPVASESTGFFDNDSNSPSSSKKRSSSDGSEEPITSKRSKTNDDDGEASQSSIKEEDDTDAEESVDSTETIQKIHSSRAFLITVGKDDCVLDWLNLDPLASNDQTDENAWNHQQTMDNMPEQPPYYHNGPSPPQSWSGYNNGFYQNSNGNNGMHPHMAPTPMNGGGIHGNQSMYGNSNNQMSMYPNGRTTPNDFNSGGYQQSQPPHQQQMKPHMFPGNNQGQQMPYQQSHSYEDRENQNQGLLMNQGPPGPNRMNNPNKVFQNQGRDSRNDRMNQGVTRSSPVQDYPPSNNSEYMTRINNNGNSNKTIPPFSVYQNQHSQTHGARHDQGYNGGNGYPHDQQHGFNRRDSYNVPPPPMNGPGGNGENMSFYSNSNRQV